MKNWCGGWWPCRTPPASRTSSMRADATRALPSLLPPSATTPTRRTRCPPTRGTSRRPDVKRIAVEHLPLPNGATGEGRIAAGHPPLPWTGPSRLPATNVTVPTVQTLARRKRHSASTAVTWATSLGPPGAPPETRHAGSANASATSTGAARRIGRQPSDPCRGGRLPSGLRRGDRQTDTPHERPQTRPTLPAAW